MKLPHGAVLRRLVTYVGLIASIAGCGGNGNTVTPSSCSFSLSPGSASHAAAGGTGSLAVTTAPNCSWTAASDADWVRVTGGTSGQGSGTVTYSVTPNTTGTARSASIKVLDVNGQGAAVLHQITQQGTDQALMVKGLYTFTIQVAPACGWPLTVFAWPVLVEAAPYLDGTTVGWVLFPPTSDRPSARWSLYASPARTELGPAEGSPGPVIAAYDVVLEGGRWEAGGPTRAPDGRGQITRGIATGARQTLKLPGSDRLWECRLDATWSLLIRYVDPD